METKRRICSLLIVPKATLSVGISTLMAIDKEKEALGGKQLAQCHT